MIEISREWKKASRKWRKLITGRDRYWHTESRWCRRWSRACRRWRGSRRSGGVWRLSGWWDWRSWTSHSWGESERCCSLWRTRSWSRPCTSVCHLVAALWGLGLSQYLPLCTSPPKSGLVQPPDLLLKIKKGIIKSWSKLCYGLMKLHAKPITHTHIYICVCVYIQYMICNTNQ